MLPEGVNGSPSMRTASDGDHHGAVTESCCHTLGSVVCTHGWMPTRDITTLAAQAHCNKTCKKQILHSRMDARKRHNYTNCSGAVVLIWTPQGGLS